MITNTDYTNNSFSGEPFEIEGCQQASCTEDSFTIFDLRYKVLQYCDIPELKMMAQCSCYWEHLVNDPAVWKNIANQLGLKTLCQKEEIQAYVQWVQMKSKSVLELYLTVPEPINIGPQKQMRDEILNLLTTPRVENTNCLKQACKAKNLLTSWCSNGGSISPLNCYSIANLLSLAQALPESVVSEMKLENALNKVIAKEEMELFEILLGNNYLAKDGILSSQPGLKHTRERIKEIEEAEKDWERACFFEWDTENESI